MWVFRIWYLKNDLINDSNPKDCMILFTKYDSIYIVITMNKDFIISFIFAKITSKLRVRLHSIYIKLE